MYTYMTHLGTALQPTTGYYRLRQSTVAVREYNLLGDLIFV